MVLEGVKQVSYCPKEYLKGVPAHVSGNMAAPPECPNQRETEEDAEGFNILLMVQISDTAFNMESYSPSVNF